MNQIKLIVGLGNPGNKYAGTRHNVGFMTVDILAERHGIKVNKLKFKALTGEGSIDGNRVILIKPQTFMNLSGESVLAAMNFFKLDMENLIVIYDDVDLTLGQIRVRPGGSAGTHNGMRNILLHLGSEDFSRVRVGIDGFRMPSEDLYEYVLRGFSREEVQTAEKAICMAADAAELLVSSGAKEAMNKFNVRPPKEKKKKTAEELSAGEAGAVEKTTEKSAGEADAVG
jgi:PTH1 family peptidyl-tRNA hydrolase